MNVGDVGLVRRVGCFEESRETVLLVLVDLRRSNGKTFPSKCIRRASVHLVPFGKTQ